MIDIDTEKSRGNSGGDMTFRNVIVLLFNAVIIWSEVLLRTSSDVQLN